jgi:gamma-glutamyltranspeptidase / glutathione hydrolase
MSNFSKMQTTRKDVIWIEVGAAILAVGVDAMDAAVATSFALGVVESWMSGPVGAA